MDYVTKFEYDGLKTTVYNAAGQKKVEQRYADGKLKTVTDEAGNQLHYVYDNAGNQTGIENTASHTVVTLVYDVLGRKRAMNDPDMGQWSYEYDALGRLILQMDALGVATCQAYDSIGRMTRRVDKFIGTREEALAGCPASAVSEVTTWQYDTAPMRWACCTK